MIGVAPAPLSNAQWLRESIWTVKAASRRVRIQGASPSF